MEQRSRKRRGTIIVILAIPLFCLFSCKSQNISADFESRVVNAVKVQMELYPESRLQDIYKNFYQDMFGPGHMIPDTTAAGNYLRRELASYSECTGPDIDPTGWEANFYRVNLSLLKENIIPYQIFFDAFTESVNGIEPPSPDEWREMWSDILVVIENMKLDLPDYQRDIAELNKLLAENNFTVHHSEAFNLHYQPHYRIIERDIFESRLRHYLKDR